MASVAARHPSFPISSVLESHGEARYSPHAHSGQTDGPPPLKKRISSSAVSMNDRSNNYRSISIAPGDQNRHVSSLTSTSHHPGKMAERDVLPPISGVRNSSNLPPSALEVKLEALDRLQTQVNLNRATLETQSKDIHRLHDSLQLVTQDIRTVWEAVERLTQEMRTRPQASSTAGHAANNDRVDDALDLMAAQVAAIQQKTNEIDQLKLQVELLKRKINRQAQSDAVPVSLGTPRDMGLHHTPIQQTAHHDQVHVTGRSTSSQQLPHRAVSQSYTPDVSHAQLDGAHLSGWATVNSHKRPYGNGAEVRSGNIESPLTSPKRMKLAPIEPRYSYDSVAGHAYPRDGTVPLESHALSTRANSPHYENSFIPYTQHERTDASLKPPGSAGRGRGRPRKNPPTDHLMTGLEKENWTSTQQLNDMAYQYGGTPGSRRSSAGYPMGLPLGSQLAGSQSLDTYAHTKRTRSKPIRNADGVLIRKDGRPDMRSQSSAANLRKVHARRDEERREAEAVEHVSAAGQRTYSGLSTVESSAAQSVASDSPISPHALPVGTPVEHLASDTDRQRETGIDKGKSKDTTEASINTPERTEKILRKMFPHGVQQERERLVITNHFFAPDNPKPVEPRAQAVAKELHQGIQALQGKDTDDRNDSDESLIEVAGPVPVAPMMIKQEEQVQRPNGPGVSAV